MLRQKTEAPGIIPVAAAKNRSVPCGFGRLGRCCSLCLMGPCRWHPADAGLLPENCPLPPGDMVAVNLRRILMLDSLGHISRLSARMKELRQRYDAGRGNDPARGDRFPDEIINDADQILQPALKGPPCEHVIAKLYPESVFPNVHRKEVALEKGLNEELLTIVAQAHSSAAPEAVLWQCLKLVLISLAAQHHLARLSTVHAKGLDLLNRPAQDRTAVRCLGERGDFLLVDRAADSPTAEEFRRLFQLKKPAAETLEDNEWPRSFIAVLEGNRAQCRQSAPVVVVLAGSATDVMAPLLLGCDVISQPPLPIGGSPEVRRFFETTLKRSLGVSYRVVTTAGFTEMIKNGQVTTR